MISKLAKLSIFTAIVLTGWIFYELYLSKQQVESINNVLAIDPTINVDVLNGLKSKHRFN
jgi:hypothetical protein